MPKKIIKNTIQQKKEEILNKIKDMFKLGEEKAKEEADAEKPAEEPAAEEPAAEEEKG